MPTKPVQPMPIPPGAVTALDLARRYVNTAPTLAERQRREAEVYARLHSGSSTAFLTYAAHLINAVTRDEPPPTKEK